MSIMNPKESVVDSYATVDHEVLEGTPWEKVAHVIPPGADVAGMLGAAHLDWGLLHLPLDTGIPVDKIPEHMLPEGFEVEEGGKIYVPVPKSFCLRRSDNLEILSPYMGNRYKPIPNDAAFEIFDQFIKAGEMTMDTAGSLHGGKHVFGMAKIGKNFILGNGEVIEGYFLLVQSHAYGFSLRAMFTPIRYPGGNTFVTALKGLKGGYYAMPHSRQFDNERIEEIKEVVTMAGDQLREFEGKARFLSGTKLSETDGVLYLATMFDSGLIQRRKLDKEKMPESLEELMVAEDANRKVKKAAKSVMEMPGADLDSCDGTAWGYYQGVVHALDNTMGHTTDTRLEASWLGKDANVKVKALDMSLVFAEKASNLEEV